MVAEMSNKVYFFTRNANSPGVTVILKAIQRGLEKRNVQSCLIDNLKDVPSGGLLVPYGTRESFEYISVPGIKPLALLVDYYSEGCRNKIKFYLRRGKFLYKDLYYSIVSYFRYHRKDVQVASAYDNVMMVSKTDIDNLSRVAKDSHLVLANNCVKLKETAFRQYDKTKPLKLGIIAHWMFVSIDETRWFIADVFKKLRSVFPGIELVIAGRGDEKLASHFFKGEGVRFIGEVESLDDFFNDINIYVATVPKGCGVLNKLLDAFSYRVFSIGVQASFSAFSDLKEGYVVCDRLEDYVNAIQMYCESQDRVRRMVDNAFEYVKRTHSDEEKNYKEVIDIIENALVSK